MDRQLAQFKLGRHRVKYAAKRFYDFDANRWGWQLMMWIGYGVAWDAMPTYFATGYWNIRKCKRQMYQHLRRLRANVGYYL